MYNREQDVFRNNPENVTSFYWIKIHLFYDPPLPTLCLPNSPFPSDSLIEALHTVLIAPVRATNPPHPYFKLLS